MASYDLLMLKLAVYLTDFTAVLLTILSCSIFHI